MGSSSGETAPSGDKNRASFPEFFQKLRKRHIIEALAAFIGGRCGTDPGHIRKMAEFILK